MSGRPRSKMAASKFSVLPSMLPHPAVGGVLHDEFGFAQSLRQAPRDILSSSTKSTRMALPSY